MYTLLKIKFRFLSSLLFVAYLDFDLIFLILLFWLLSFKIVSTRWRQSLARCARCIYTQKEPTYISYKNTEMRNNEEGEYILNTNIYTTKDTCKPLKQKEVHKNWHRTL